MPATSVPLEGGLVPDEPMQRNGAASLGQVTEMLDGRPEVGQTDEISSGWEGLMERIAADLYRIASMLLGEGEDAIGLIEEAISSSDLTTCSNHLDARQSCRLRLAGQAIEILRDRDAAALAAPEDGGLGPASCIDGDELDAAGVTSAELEAMLNGPDNQRLRAWIEGLPVPLRVTFVLRAVAGLGSPEIAELLAEHGGSTAEGWTPEAVRSIFRQALCSLAGQLLHATAER